MLKQEDEEEEDFCNKALAYVSRSLDLERERSAEKEAKRESLLMMPERNAVCHEQARDGVREGREGASSHADGAGGGVSRSGGGGDMHMRNVM